jgi:hypothetical protein
MLDYFVQTNETLTIITNKAIIDVNQVGFRPIPYTLWSFPHALQPGSKRLSCESHVEEVRQRGRRSVTLGRQSGEQVCPQAIFFLH